MNHISRSFIRSPPERTSSGTLYKTKAPTSPSKKKKKKKEKKKLIKRLSIFSFSLTQTTAAIKLNGKTSNKDSSPESDDDQELSLEEMLKQMSMSEESTPRKKGSGIRSSSDGKDSKEKVKKDSKRKTWGIKIMNAFGDKVISEK